MRKSIKRVDVTPTVVANLHKKGLTPAEIGEKLTVSISTVRHRMILAGIDIEPKKPLTTDDITAKMENCCTRVDLAKALNLSTKMVDTLLKARGLRALFKASCRTNRSKRNMEISFKAVNGISVEDLAAEYGLAVRTIKRIVSESTL